jgi:HK97 family phage major capsid protein
MATSTLMRRERPALKHLTDDYAIIAGYGVVFGGRDIEGDTFMPNTDFRLDMVAQKPVFYDHTLEQPQHELGHVVKVVADEYGLWIEAQLDRFRAYVDEVLKLVEQGALGWSSGSVSHLVRREAGVVKCWPIVEFSLTPTPCEPRTVGIQRVKTMEAMEAIEEGGRMSEQTLVSMQQQVAALSEQVGQLLRHAADAPAIRNAGFISPDGGTADRNVKTFGDFLTAVSRGDVKRLREIYGSTKRMEESAGASGGYVVPQQFVSRLMEVAVERSIVRPLAFVLPMSSRDASIPAVDYSGDYVAGSSAFLGGMEMQWMGEGATVPIAEPKFRKLELVAHKMSGKVPVSNELLADNAVGLEALLVRLFGSAVAFAEDYAFLRGDGVGKPLGVLNADATIQTATALTAAAPTVAELSAMYKRLIPASRATAVWVVNSLLTDSLMAINSDSSNANALTYLPNLQGRIEPRLFGLPVLESEKMPSTFADGGLMLADFQQYVIGSRQHIEIAMSEHVNFDTDETVWRVTARVEGQPWMNAPIAIGSGGSDTVSAFVKSQ